MCKSRLEPFSDGVIAIAATLLVLNIAAALAIYYALPLGMPEG